MCDHSPGARHLGVRSQVGLRKHHYKQSQWSDGIPAELFQILKGDAVKVLHSICQQVWKTQQWPQDWKRSVFILNPKKGNAKMFKMFELLYNCAHLTCQQSNAQNSLSQASTVCKLRTSRCSSWIQKAQKNHKPSCQHPLDHIKKQENSRKTSTSASLTMLKPLAVWITTNCGKFLKTLEYQLTLPASFETCMSQEATVRTDIE